MGSGKTTAISSLSDIEVVRTEAANTDRASADKATTTVALDYGEISIDDHEKVRLYGVPGQKRFDFMWAILKKRAKGMVLLVNNDVADPIALMDEYLQEFRDLHERGEVAVGVTRSDLADGPRVEEYVSFLDDAYPHLIIPVFFVDPRNGDHMRTLLMTLVANIEAKMTFANVTG